MNTFLERLGQWLPTIENERRGGMLLVLFALYSADLASFRTLVILGGLCLMAEGLAMLISAPRR